MKKIIYTSSLLLTALIVASPVFAAGADVSKVQTFIQSIIQIFVTLAALVATAFLVWGGFRYMTSSGNPESLDVAKKTIMFSAIGLAIVLGAYVLSNIVTQVATSAFGTI
ncbi:MAG: pilin [Microgenomates group bacterium]|jgi:TRAP-type C4-dicarboxylate transport system permease small subunit